jgi:hypothetical protein
LTKSLEEFRRPAKERIRQRIVQRTGQRILQRPARPFERGLRFRATGGKDRARTS